MDTRVGPIVNHLLASLPAADYRRLQPHLEIVTLTAGETLFPRSGQFAYFPIDSIVALSYVIEAGVTAMACFVGREGMLGMESPLGTSPRGSRAEVQFGGTALRITAVALRQELNRGGTLHLLLQRYLFALITQSLQLAVCNQHHGLEQRLCRFLGSLFERMDGDAIYLTQTQLALMMGSRRESITEKSARLKSAGLIHYQRGHLRLVSLRALSERACGCGPIIRDAFAKVSSAADPGSVIEDTSLPIAGCRRALSVANLFRTPRSLLDIAGLVKMKKASIFLPVTCPRCGVRSMSRFPIGVVMVALTQWNQMALYANCHPPSWSASPLELQAIRAYLVGLG